MFDCFMAILRTKNGDLYTNGRLGLRTKGNLETIHLHRGTPTKFHMVFIWNSAFARITYEMQGNELSKQKLSSI